MRKLYSIGVDVGTSTMKVIISRFEVQKESGFACIPRARIIGKEILYRGPVTLTPLLDDSTVDFARVRAYVANCLESAGVTAGQIETGAVIITGETARKDNARQVTRELSQYLGEFIVETAGPELEALLAAHGSGAMAFSKSHQNSVLNLDIGGGTTNAALCVKGENHGLFAMDIGGRLVRLDVDRTVTYVSPRIRFLLESLKIPLKPGEKAALSDMKHLCRALSECLLEAAEGKELSEASRRLMITPLPPLSPPPTLLSFSGGVSEYMDRPDALKNPFRHGDMGVLLAAELFALIRERNIPCHQNPEGIRATVIGAGNHTLSLSGSTVYISDPKMLPLKNLPIIKLHYHGQAADEICTELTRQYDVYAPDAVAVFAETPAAIDYEALKALASALLDFYKNIPGEIVVLLRRDLAKALGQMLNRQVKGARPILCLDEIEADSGNYVDIGKPVDACVPVVVKTLIYQS